MHLAPPIITVMIDMFLGFGSNKDSQGEIKYLYVFNNQQTISMILLVVSLLTVPIMLAVKPLVLKRRMSHHHVEEDNYVRLESVTYERSADGKQFLRNDKFD